MQTRTAFLLFFRGSASRPRASRAMGGAPLKAAAGRATAVKLQIIESATVWIEPGSFCMRRPWVSSELGGPDEIAQDIAVLLPAPAETGRIIRERLGPEAKPDRR